MIGELKAGVVLYDTGEKLLTPFYYIEQLENETDTMIVAYELEPKQIKKYRKTGEYGQLHKPYKVTQVTPQRPKSTGTPLGNLMKDQGKFDKKPHISTQYKTASFVSILEQGIDTQDGNFQSGFKEMKPKSIGEVVQDHYAKKTNMPNQEETGVFIGLSHVHWLKDVISPDYLKDYLSYLHNYYIVRRGLQTIEL